MKSPRQRKFFKFPPKDFTSYPNLQEKSCGVHIRMRLRHCANAFKFYIISMITFLPVSMHFKAFFSTWSWITTKLHATNTVYLLYWVTAGWVREQLKMFLLQVIQVCVSKAFQGLPTCTFPSKIDQDIFKHLQEFSFVHAFPSFNWVHMCVFLMFNSCTQQLKTEERTENQAKWITKHWRILDAAAETAYVIRSWSRQH